MTEVSRLIDSYAKKAPKPAAPAHEAHSHRCESCGGDLPEELPDEAEAHAAPIDEDTKAALYVKALRERKT